LRNFDGDGEGREVHAVYIHLFISMFMYGARACVLLLEFTTNIPIKYILTVQCSVVILKEGKKGRGKKF